MFSLAFVGFTVHFASKQKQTLMKNRLFYGDNLEVLRKHVAAESVDLCYIDPPFNSKRDYNQIYNNVGSEDKAQARAFTDTWVWDSLAAQGYDAIVSNEGGRFTSQTIELIQGLKSVLKQGSLLAYLVSMTVRVAEIHRVLKSTGSFFLHCDPTASHYLKLITDAIFCSQGGDYRNEIIWRRTGAHNKLTRFAPLHDVILYYTKSDKFVWNRPKRPYMKGHIDNNFVRDGKGYRTDYYGNVLTGSGTRGGESGKPWKGFDPTIKGRHWAVPGKLVEALDEDLSSLTQHQKLDRLFDLGYITIEPGEAWPVYGHYLSAKDGQPLSDLWTFQPYTEGTVFGTKEGVDADTRWLSPQDRERLGYPTQKPEGLLARIIGACSKPDDTVLDAYCGCGTTIAVAQQLGRRWIGVDITYQSIALIERRLEKAFGPDVLKEVAFSGIPRDMASAAALRDKKDDRLRKEFEKWAVLTYTNNRAVINDKKGGDKGIDGIAYFKTSRTDAAKVILSVKSGSLAPTYVRDLRGVMDREKAPLGRMIVFEKPSAGIIKEAKTAGVFDHDLMGRKYDCIEIVTVEEMLESGRRLDIPMSEEVLRSAEIAARGDQFDLKLSD